LMGGGAKGARTNNGVGELKKDRVGKGGNESRKREMMGKSHPTQFSLREKRWQAKKTEAKEKSLTTGGWIESVPALDVF